MKNYKLHKLDHVSQHTQQLRKRRGIFLMSVAVCLCAYCALTTQTFLPNSVTVQDQQVQFDSVPTQREQKRSQSAPEKLSATDHTYRSEIMPSGEMIASNAILPISGIASEYAVAENQADSLQSVWQGQEALLKMISLLEEGHANFSEVGHYTATITKRERINGKLSNEQDLLLSMQHKPYKVSLRWIRGYRDQTIYYETGKNNGRMLIKLNGWQGRFTPTLKLLPESPLAMRRARYPVTQVGILELARQLLEDRRLDVLENRQIQVELKANQVRKNRDCYVCVLRYQDATESPMYRKSIAYIDREMLIPFYVENYTWAKAGQINKDDDSTLLERYHYFDWQFQTQYAELSSQN